MSIIYALKDSEKFLYHYTSAEKALEHILKDRTLLLNNLFSTNDPKESKEWKLSPFTLKNPISRNFHDDSISKVISAQLKNSAFLTCFCIDKKELSGDHCEDILLRGLAKSRMWAQYADSHRGFCLVFDKELLLANLRAQFDVFFFGEVHYKNRSWVTRIEPNPFRIEYDLLEKTGVENYCRWHAMKYAKELYFEKLEDWRDESEWRAVVIGDVGSRLLLHFEKSLIGIVHGANTSAPDSEKAIKLASESSIEHTGLRWFNQCPWYDLGNPIWSLR